MISQWNKDTINDLLLTNERAVERALLVLLNRQTHDEITSQQTRHHNGRGFSGPDAEIMTSMALRVQSGRSLTYKQLGLLRKTDKKGYCRLAKYHGQLVEEIKAKAAQKETVQ